MIWKIENSEKDNRELKKLKILSNNELDGFDFSIAIVNKPWGYEYLSYKGKNSSIWILHLKKGFQTSMHCHLYKRTVLLLLSGEAECLTLNKKYNLKSSDALIFNKKVFHSTRAVSEGGIIVMEIETPPKKTDLIRLTDIYGRELRGYELQKEMSFDLEKYNRICFNDNEIDILKRCNDICLSLKKLNKESIKDFLNKPDNPLIVLLEGKFFNDSNPIIFGEGDLFEKRRIIENGLWADGPIKILIIENDTQY